MKLYLAFWTACGVGLWKSTRCVLRSGFGKNGIGRNVLRPWASFFRPNFHPWDQNDRPLLARGDANLAMISAERAGFLPNALRDSISIDFPATKAA